VCYAFIKIKFTSCHLLLYVVYTCQKSFNSINAFACYKQKCKLAPFKLVHHVDAVDVLCAQLMRDLFAIAKFLV